MKKIYNAPFTKVVKIKAEQMLQGSIELKGNYNGTTMTIAGKDDYDEEDDLW